jgi:hypothetical protein
MEWRAVASIKLDMTHGDNHSVIIMSGSSTALREAPAPKSVDHELVVREARRRQRMRWLVIGLTAVVVACLSAAFIGLAGGRSATKELRAQPAGPQKVTPAARPTSNAVISGTLEACGPGPSPVVTLHDRDGHVVTTAVWHPVASSGTGSANKRTVHFSFSVRQGDYYLTMNNEYPMPAQARQIYLTSGQAFVTHILACT